MHAQQRYTDGNISEDTSNNEIEDWNEDNMQPASFDAWECRPSKPATKHEEW